MASGYSSIIDMMISCSSDVKAWKLLEVSPIRVCNSGDGVMNRSPYRREASSPITPASVPLLLR